MPLDNVVLALLGQLKTTNGPIQIRRLSNQLERVIFHKQFQNVSLA
jgi:hypothetical protein